MKTFSRTFYKRKRWVAFSAALIGAFLALGLLTGNNVSANHPVLVEGNCDSPVPGTTIVNIGQCGDFDGDGRIGTAEDTDGADRIFGTLKAALGPGTGAAAGTGANNNGTITIVKSGRYAEELFIGDLGLGPPDQGATNPGNVTIQAVPGIDAGLDAVLQGDPAGGNTARQAGVGIQIYHASTGKKVVLRNLSIRNFAWGIYATLNSNVTVDNCRFEHNFNYGIQAVSSAKVFVIGSRFAGTGFRIPVTGVPAPGHAISYEGSSSGEVVQTQITGSFGRALSKTSTGAVTYYELFLGDNGSGIVGATRNNTP